MNIENLKITEYNSTLDKENFNKAVELNENAH